ncbi:MAG: ComEC/Rec2 family competence protein [Parasphingorhabdus sp.]|uniref:ComEC/Rec2 family competence protein n=1 Tax=Parasphingorhabdus sp. TaxID=2709688 RepID=UPI00329936EB
MFAEPAFWIGFIAVCGAVALSVKLYPNRRRSCQLVFCVMLLSALGCANMWQRALTVAQPVLDRPVVTSFYAKVDGMEELRSRQIVRLTLVTGSKQNLPPRVRVNVPISKIPTALQSGMIISVRARLMPPAMPSLPGVYNFSQRAWFMGLGATGQAIGPIAIVETPPAPLILLPPMDDIRQKLSRHVQSKMANGAGAIGATLASGDRGAINDADAEAMRRSGLAHLLSISGLHVTAIVGASYLFVLRLLALFPPLALRFRLPLFAAGCAAFAAVGYTLMTGAQVPTIRACIAALLILLALAMGRSAITLRMVAAGALMVLIIWPEALFGPSFQLSFAAVTAIIAMHEHPRIMSLLARRDERFLKRVGRLIFGLFLTGLIVELALMPIALFHFHKAGIYGALANIIAIPLTTFVIMPLEALALILDLFDLGAPIWWLCEQALQSLLHLAHFVSSSPGSVTLMPTVAMGVFAMIIAGGLWFSLWSQSWRLWGLIPICLGVAMILLARAPDIYITGDGRHVAIRNGQDQLIMLRQRSGEFVRDMIQENAGIAGDMRSFDHWSQANCNGDSCTVTMTVEERSWTIVAIRSSYYIPAIALSAACERADIVISERRLPASCQPRWLKADRPFLGRFGGITIDLSKQKVRTVLGRSGNHKWMRFKTPEKSR